jgi:hypothetical protein
MLEVEYATALATVFCEENLPQSVFELRMNGIRRLKGIANLYVREGIAVKFLEAMWREKIPFVLSAASPVIMAEILKPSTPKYINGKIAGRSPYHSEVEEIILWALVSPNNRLISRAADRYRELFQKHFPDEAADIWPAAS